MDSPPIHADPASAERMQYQVDGAIERALADRRLVGAVVLVAHRGALLHRRAAGLADREARRPMREDTLFRLASVTKPIVAAAALALVGQGRLALEDPVSRWLPAFRPRLADGSAPPILIRQLLTHTSGLGYRFKEAGADGPLARAGVSDGMDHSGISLAENLRRLAAAPLLFAPGTAWHYSLGLDVLGAVIEAACGLPLPEAVSTLVTAPLGMRDTAFHALEPARLATPYVNDDPAPRILGEGETVAADADIVGVRFSPARALDPAAFPSGGAGMVGSAGDVLRLLETLRRGGAPLMPAALAQAMGRDQIPGIDSPDLPGQGYGYGFSVLRDPAAAGSPASPGTWRWGGVYGHSWFVDPAREVSVVALTNTLYEGTRGRFVEELRAAVYAALDLR